MLTLIDLIWNKTTRRQSYACDFEGFYKSEGFINPLESGRAEDAYIFGSSKVELLPATMSKNAVYLFHSFECLINIGYGNAESLFAGHSRLQLFENNLPLLTEEMIFSGPKEKTLLYTYFPNTDKPILSAQFQGAIRANDVSVLESDIPPMVSIKFNVFQINDLDLIKQYAKVTP